MTAEEKALEVIKDLQDFFKGEYTYEDAAHYCKTMVRSVTVPSDDGNSE